MRRTITLEMAVETVDAFESDSTEARVYYPDEGSKIQIRRGLSYAEVRWALLHEIGHVIDWYMSNGQQSEDVSEREEAADAIGAVLLMAPGAFA